MSNKFKIGDRVRFNMPTAKIDTIGVIDSFYFCIDEDAYIYTFFCEDTIKKWDVAEMSLSLIDKSTDKTDPSHYKNQSIEVWDMMIRIWGEEKFIAFCEMNAFKYRLRLGSKEGESIEDEIKKAQRYEQRANELRE